MSEVIATSTTDITPPTLTKEELKKQKRAIYQKEYMREYHKKRMETDEAYREYRTNISRANNKKMYSKYINAFNYVKENKINV
jgi:hypothetical protein